MPVFRHSLSINGQKILLPLNERVVAALFLAAALLAEHPDTVRVLLLFIHPLIYLFISRSDGASSARLLSLMTVEGKK